MSTGLLLGVAGAGIGGMFGMPGLGFAIGSALGNAFFNDSPDLPSVEGPRLNDLRVQGSSYGTPIPLHFGRNRLAGQIIWAPPIQEHAHTEEVSAGGGKGGSPPSQTQTNYTYTASFAVAICRGPVSGFGRIWLDGKLFYDGRSIVSGGEPLNLFTGNLFAGNLFTGLKQTQGVVFYTGSATQLPDPTIQADKGIGNVPAYRDLAYIVFTDLKIDDYGRRIPNVTVEVFSDGTTEIGKKLSATSGDYFWGDQTSDTHHVMTANTGGVLRVLTLETQRVRLLDMAGQFIAEVGKDEVIDAYGQQAAHSCGRLNGYSLHFVGDVNYPLNHSSLAPRILPYAIPEALNQTQGDNLLAVVENKNEYLLGFAVSSDQGRAVIITGQGSGVPGSPCTPSRWYRLHLSGDNALVQASGSAQGLPPATAGGFGIGNRAGLGGVIGTFTYAFHAAGLETDGVHYWHVNGAGEKTVTCYQLGSLGVATVYQSNLTQNGFAYPTLIAAHGMLWVTNRYQVESFTRVPLNLSQEPALSQVVYSLCQLAKLNTAEVDVSSLTGTVRGYTLGRQTSVRTALQQLMTAFLFDAVESGGKIKFIPRGQAPALTISEEALAAHVQGESLPDSVTVKRQQELELPKRVNITHINPETDYQPGYQYAARIETSALDETSVELAIVLTPTEALQIADKLLHGLWQARETHRFQVGVEYLSLEPCDVVEIKTEKARYFSRLTSVEWGAPGLLMIEGVAEAASVYSSSLIAQENVGFVEQTLQPKGPTELRLLDIPMLRALDNQAGFYLAACGYYAGWQGASVLQSRDKAAWQMVKNINTPAVMGVAHTVLGNGPVSLPDKSASLFVFLLQGELFSLTDAQFFEGGNLACIGNEIVQFRDALLQEDGRYRLSYFLRGRFGTEFAVDTHQAYEPFTLLTQTGLQRLILDENSIGQTLYYQGVTHGAVVEPLLAKPFTFHAVGLMPYAPVHIKGSRDSQQNLTITWIRRTRYGGQWRDNVEVPLGEASERYELDILSGETVVRTLSVTMPTASYSAAQQQADGLNPGELVSVIVYQLSDSVGRGRGAKAIL